MKSWIARHAALVFILLNVLPTGAFLLAARTWSWNPAQAQAFQLPLLFSPVVTAYWLTSLRDGHEGVARLTRKLLHARVGLRWWLVAVFGFALLAALALGIRYLHDGALPHAARAGGAEAVLLIPFLFLFPGLTEEPGWRGFLQPELERRSGLLIASVGVGLTWGLWHARSLATDPERFAGDGFPWFLGYTVAVAIILGWLSRRTEGSVLIAIAGHFGANLVNFFAPMGSGVADGNRNWKIYFVILAITGLALSLFETRRGRSPSST